MCVAIRSGNTPHTGYSSFELPVRLVEHSLRHIVTSSKNYDYNTRPDRFLQGSNRPHPPESASWESKCPLNPASSG